MELPALDPSTMYRVDRIGSSFWAAIHWQEGELALSVMERRRTEHWLYQCYRNLERLSDVL
jgi:hypothetical protein